MTHVSTFSPVSSEEMTELAHDARALAGLLDAALAILDQMTYPRDIATRGLAALVADVQDKAQSMAETIEQFERRQTLMSTSIDTRSN